MADNPFTAPTQSGYNSDPPPDDGTKSAANLVKWASVKTKLSDPNKTYIDDLVTQVTAFGNSTINTGSNQSNALGGSLALSGSELTIASGAVTATRSYHTIDTESDAASDALDTIGTGSVADNAILILRAENTDRTVTITHEAGGAGQIHLAGDTDYALDDDEKSVILQRRSTDWYELTRDAEQSPLVQTVSTTDGEAATGTTVMPADDTIPQNTEGDEFLTLAITPTNASSTLIIQFEGMFSASASKTIAVALFKDSTANALAATAVPDAGNTFQPLTIQHSMTAGTTSEITFKIRAGVTVASGTTTFNGTGSARKFGGVSASSMVITELLP